MDPLFAEFTSNHVPDRWQVCLADCHDYLSFDELAEILYGDHLRLLEQTDILVIRLQVDVPVSVDALISHDLTPVSKRAPRSSLHLLFTDNFEVKLSQNRNAAVADRLLDDQLRAEFLGWLQDKELYQFIKRSNALFQARSNFVYRAPSKRYVNMFLRVGNVQRSRQVLDAFFFWMLPTLKGRSGILTDTWSISSIALNTARLLERYWTGLTTVIGDARQPSLQRCHVDMLASYPDDLLVVLPETRDLLRRAAGDGRRDILVLLSAVATGNSLTRLREAVAQAELRAGEFDFLALYKLEKDVDIPALCDLSDGVGGMKFSAIPREQVQHRTVIEIDRGAYFPLEIKETALLISPDAAAPAKEFFTEYQNTSVIALHRNSVDLANQKLRHHGVYIDVEAMLSHPRFQTRFRMEVSKLDPRPSLVIAPPHRAGKLLAGQVAALLAMSRDPPRVFIHPDLRLHSVDVPCEIRDAVAETTILVIDDVSVTGQRLSRYQQSLRELRFKGRIVFMVGVARPDIDKRWDRRVIELRFRSGVDAKHEVICIERVIIPDWDGRTCPWCMEGRSLSNLVQQERLKGETLTMAVRRIMALQRASIEKGLIEGVIWHPQTGDRLSLTPNSLFIDDEKGSATEADVMAAVAAAVQQMRIAKKEEKRLDSAYPHVSVLDTENYFGKRFNDDILRIAILRSATRGELERWDGRLEEERRALVSQFLQRKENREAFLLELAVARLANKIPQPELTSLDEPEMKGWPADLWRAFRT